MMYLTPKSPINIKEIYWMQIEIFNILRFRRVQEFSCKRRKRLHEGPD